MTLECVFCSEECLTNSPVLLKCLHLCCAACLDENERSEKDPAGPELVDLADGGEPLDRTEVSCPICQVSMTRAEVLEGFLGGVEQGKGTANPVLKKVRKCTGHSRLDIALKEGFNNLQQRKVEIEESIKSLDSKILVLNSSEDVLQQHLDNIKSSLVAIITLRHEELSQEIRDYNKDKKIILESRNSKLLRTHTQTDQALWFLDDILSKQLEVSDDKISHIQEMMISQVKRLQKAKTSVSVDEPENKSELSFRGNEDYRGTRLLPSLVQVAIAVLNDLHLTYGPSDPPQQGQDAPGSRRVGRTQIISTTTESSKEMKSDGNWQFCNI